MCLDERVYFQVPTIDFLYQYTSNVPLGRGTFTDSCGQV
jgi:hypothetical protein